MFVSSACIIKMAEALDLTNAKTMNARGAEYVGRENHAVFRSVVGMLLWLSFERLDIHSGVKRFTQWLVEPLMQDWIALKRSVRYLLRTKSLVIRYEVDLKKTSLKPRSMQVGLCA